ncbi:MAG: hypothetical protein R3303_09085 [Marinobacter sp.]|nr:hypothetical protein [Marinobacter sp.]
MIQDTLKQSMKKTRETRARFEQQLRPRVSEWSQAVRKMVSELGADVSEPRPLADIIADLRRSNPSLRDFNRRLDLATYDLRKKLWWDANMMTAYVTDRAERAYRVEIKPRLEQARSHADASARRALTFIRELTERRDDMAK